MLGNGLSFKTGIGLALLCFTLTSQVGAAGAAPWEGAIEYMFRFTPAGAAFVGRITGVEAEEISAATYRSFVQRLGWNRFQTLNRELSSRLRTLQVESEFAQLRAAESRAAALEPGETLTAQERDLLIQASEVLRDQALEDLVQDSTRLVNAQVGPHHAPAREGSLRENIERFVADEVALESIGPSAETSPEPHALSAESATDLRKLRLWPWNRLAIRLRAYRGIFKSLYLSEGEWRSLFTSWGKKFTPEDLVRLRRLYRVLGVLNDYSRMRLVVRAFAEESSVLYTRLNDLAQDVTRRFKEGLLTVDAYVSARQAAAKEAGLPLNDIVWEAERRMLGTLERCYTLGGRVSGRGMQGGAIQLAEARLLKMQERLRRIEEVVKADEAAGRKKEHVSHLAERDLWKQRVELASTELQKKYVEFVQSRGRLETFANLPFGRVDSELVTPMDLPDAFMVTQEQVMAWKELYDRALYHATNELVAGETQLFIVNQTELVRIGADSTRRFIREMNQLTSQVVGKRFTETRHGKEFEEFARHKAVDLIKTMGKFLGIAIPTAIVEDRASHWVERLKDAILGDDPNSPQGKEKGKDPSQD